MSEYKQWPAEDIKLLQEFCQQHGIEGFDSGNIPPAVALMMLKEKMGLAKDEFPKTNKYTPEFTYMEAIKQKQKILLKG